MATNAHRSGGLRSQRGLLGRAGGLRSPVVVGLWRRVELEDPVPGRGQWTGGGRWAPTGPARWLGVEGFDLAVGIEEVELVSAVARRTERGWRRGQAEVGEDLVQDDAPYALPVRPSAGGDHDWIEERVYRAGLDRGCILDMNYHPYQDTSVHSRHNWSHDAVIIELEDLDEYSEHRFAGTVTLPGDHDGLDGMVQYVIIAFDYALN